MNQTTDFQVGKCLLYRLNQSSPTVVISVKSRKHKSRQGWLLLPGVLFQVVTILESASKSEVYFSGDKTQMDDLWQTEQQGF